MCLQSVILKPKVNIEFVLKENKLYGHNNNVHNITSIVVRNIWLLYICCRSVIGYI